ncbi:MAG: hypothetical protein NTY68_01190 [Candidatus Micrarchaeota archaeon]|nr:hypothetical protein [Candidatus Micrarchaeota archaeon]
MVQKQKEIAKAKKENINYPAFTDEKDIVEYLGGKRGLFSRQNEMGMGRALRKMRGRLALEYAVKIHNPAIAGTVYLKMLGDGSELQFFGRIREILAKEDAKNSELFKGSGSWLKNLDYYVNKQDKEGIGHILEVALTNMRED